MWLLNLFGIGPRRQKIPRKLRLKATMTYHCIKRDIEAKNAVQSKPKLIITELADNGNRKTAPDSVNEGQRRK